MPHIHRAEKNTNEGIINEQSGTLEKLAIHSDHVSRDSGPFRNELRDEMLSESGLTGGEGTYKCPFMKIAFTNALKSDYDEPSTEDEGDTRITLFDRGWDGELVFTNTRIVTDNMITGGLVAGYTAPGSTALPEVVPLESSLARKDGGIWKRFDPSESQLPTNFITNCYTDNVKRELRIIRDDFPERLRAPAGEADRTNLA